jgi:hypothetical protein
MNLKNFTNNYLSSFEKGPRKTILVLLLGNFFLTIFLFIALPENRINPLVEKSQKKGVKTFFSKESTRIILPLTLAFPLVQTKKAVPIFILNKDKNIIAERAFLIPQKKESADPILGTENTPLQIIELPFSELPKLIPFLGSTLWGLPQFKRKKDRNHYEINF